MGLRGGSVMTLTYQLLSFSHDVDCLGYYQHLKTLTLVVVKLIRATNHNYSIFLYHLINPYLSRLCHR